MIERNYGPIAHRLDDLAKEGGDITAQGVGLRLAEFHLNNTSYPICTFTNQVSEPVVIAPTKWRLKKRTKSFGLSLPKGSNGSVSTGSKFLIQRNTYRANVLIGYGVYRLVLPGGDRIAERGEKLRNNFPILFTPRCSCGTRDKPTIRVQPHLGI